MNSPIRYLLWMVLMIALAGSLGAHSGHGSEMQVRVFDDKMRIVIRTSIPLAWARLGGSAPALADEEGRRSALPMLVAAAPAMVEVVAGGRTMAPTMTDCLFEVGDHVAFVLVFPRPVEWPVEMNAGFVDTLGPLDTAAVSVFDHTGSRFIRDLKPLMEKDVAGGDSWIKFFLAATESGERAPAGARGSPPETPGPASVPARGPSHQPTVFLILLAACALLGWGFSRNRRKAG